MPTKEMKIKNYPGNKEVKIENGRDINSAIAECDGNWNVRIEGVQSDTLIAMPDKRMIVRDDKNIGLGIVSSKYHAIQNSEVWAMADTIMQNSKNAKITKYTEIDYGRIFSISLDFDRMEIKGAPKKGDMVTKKLYLSSSHDGTRNWVGDASLERCFCDNGCTMDEKVSSFRIPHASTKEIRLKQALAILKRSSKLFEVWKESCEILAQKSLDKKLVESFLNDLFKTKKDENGIMKESTREKNVKDQIIHLAHDGKGNSGQTVWDLYNGVTEYYDHYHTENMEKRINTIQFGASRKIKDRAFSLALNYAKN